MFKTAQKNLLLLILFYQLYQMKRFSVYFKKIKNLYLKNDNILTESHSLRHIRVKNADYFTKFKKKKKKLKNVKKALIINSF